MSWLELASSKTLVDDLTNLCKGKSCCLCKYDLKYFLCLFLPGRGKTAKNLLDIQETIVSLCENIDEEDIRQQLLCDAALLAKKYLAITESRRPKHFRSFVRKYLPMYLKDWLLDFSKQMLDNPETISTIESVEPELFEFKSLFSVNRKDKIFQGITDYEALILWFKFIENLSVRDIAEKTFVDKGTVQKYINIALDKVRNNIQKGD